MSALPRSLSLLETYEDTQAVLDVLQEILDSGGFGVRKAALACVRHLGADSGLLPRSFVVRGVKKLDSRAVWGGGFADIWRGRMPDDQPVCLKVLRLFIVGDARQKLMRLFCSEALLWKQLHHPRILPFIGINEDMFAPSFCLVSPWMEYGNIVKFLADHPDHDRLKIVCEIAEGLSFLHSHDPPIVHADVRGANILMKSDLTCCLADFGLSVFLETRVPSSSRLRSGAIRWLPPEVLDPGESITDVGLLPSRDVYSFGCTIVEIYSGEPPFAALRHEAAVVTEIILKKRKPARPSNPDLHDEVWSVAEACMSYCASTRPFISYIKQRVQSLMAAEAARNELALASIASNPLLVWVDDKPENIQSFVDYGRTHGVEVQTFVSTYAARVWINQNYGTIRARELAGQLRIVSDLVRVESDRPGTPPVEKLSAGHGLLRFIRGRGLVAPFLVFTGDWMLEETKFVLDYENAGSTCHPDVGLAFIDTLQSGIDYARWSGVDIRTANE